MPRDTGINQWEWEGKNPAVWSIYPPVVTPDMWMLSIKLSLMVHNI